MRLSIGPPWRSLTLAGVLLAGALVLSGCFVLSVHPVYTTDTLTFDAGLVGTWGDPTDGDSETWQFQDNGDSSYKLIIRDKDTTEIRPQDGQFLVHLLQLGDDVYMDLYPEEPAAGNEFYKAHIVPAHSLWRLVREGDMLTLYVLSHDAIEDMIEKQGRDIAHVEHDGALVLTAPPEELQALFREHRDVLFDDSDAMPRIR